MQKLSGRLLAARVGHTWRDGRPIYQALADAIRVLILDGRLPVGAALPAERDLATALGVSRTTVTGAYDRLRSAGYLRSRRGSGSITQQPAGSSTARTIGWAPPPPDADAIDLAIAALPGPDPALARAAAAAVAQLPRYVGSHGYDTIGLGTLREVIATRYSRQGVPTTADEVLITNGAQYGLVLALRLLTRPGQRVMVECPTFPNALTAVAAAHTRAIGIPLDRQGWPTDVLTDTIRRANPAACYLIPDFHNPTGQVMPDDDRAALALAAAHADSYVLADETFADLGFDARPTPTAAFDPGGRVISIGSMSKSHWGGLRVGWIRAAAPLIGRLANCRAGLDMAQPVVEQLIAVELLADQDILPAQRTLLRHRRDHLAALLRESLPAWQFRLPAGGMALWVDLGAPISTALTLAAARQGVVIASGARFGDAASLENRIRIPFTASDGRLADAVERLARALPEARRYAGAADAPAVA